MTDPRLIGSLASAALLSIAGSSFGGGGGGGGDDDDLLEFEFVIQIGAGHTLGEFMSQIAPYAQDIEVEQELGGDTFEVEIALNPNASLLELWAAVYGMILNGTLTWGENNFTCMAPEGRTDSLWFTGLQISASAYESQYANGVLHTNTALQHSSGAGITIAIIDTGLDQTHPLFARNIVPGWDFIAGSSSISDPADGIDNDHDGLIDEMVGHGTFVASVARFAARDAFIMPIRALDTEGNGNQFTIGLAVNWAIDHGADVINMSMGSNGNSTVVTEAILRAKTLGIPVVCAGGNKGVLNSSEYPANDTNAFPIAATDINDVKAPFSNWGSFIYLSCPGESTMLNGEYQLSQSIIGAKTGGGFAIWNGTSFSAGFTSGAVAAVLSQHPEWPSATVPLSQMAATAMGYLASGAVDIDSVNLPVFANGLGAGRLDCDAALALSPEAPFMFDLDDSGTVDGADLSLFLGDWGDCWIGSCPSDINRDGTANGQDLALLFANWS
ncbi:MAG: S8 family serine peptidase [Planctomycetota bacterium]|nr:S8 family serine peptidase [Planctomycetota bacterium]